MSGTVRWLVVCGVLTCLLGPAAERLTAAGRFPLIQRAVTNIRERGRVRSEAETADGQLAPQGDPFAAQPAAGQAGMPTPRPAAADRQEPPYRPFFRWWAWPPNAGLQSPPVGQVPTLAPPRQAAGSRVPTPAPPKPVTGRQLASPDGQSAVRQAVSILAAPEPRKPAAAGPSSVSPRGQAPPKQSGPREF